ncbi:MAG: glycosyltransferase family 4 protein [Bacteroidota bacterium]
MKILLISKYFKTGGAAISSARLFEALKMNGVDVKMLVQEEHNEKEGVYATTGGMVKRWINLGRFIIERLTFLRHESSKTVRFLFSPANAGENLIRNRHVKEADIIHLHWINAAFLSVRSLKKLFNSGKPVVWTFHDMWAFTGGCHYALECDHYTRECGQCPYLKKPGKGDLSHRIWKRKEKLFRDNKVTVITPSKWLNECASSSSLLRHCEFHTIRYSMDQTLFKPAEREMACRNLGLDPEKKYILFGAAAVRSMLKGFDFFLEAIRILHKALDPEAGVEILLFGKTSGDEDRLFPMNTRNISYINSPETIAELYSAAHLFVIPSLQDNFPNTILESMLCGTPVVGFRSGGIPEMIDHKVTGYLAEHKSSTDLAEGMKWVLFTDAYESMSAEARSSAVRRYSRKQAAEKHVALYKELLNRSRES